MLEFMVQPNLWGSQLRLHQKRSEVVRRREAETRTSLLACRPSLLPTLRLGLPPTARLGQTPSAALSRSA